MIIVDISEVGFIENLRHAVIECVEWMKESRPFGNRPMLTDVRACALCARQTTSVRFTRDLTMLGEQFVAVENVLRDLSSKDGTVEGPDDLKESHGCDDESCWRSNDEAVGCVVLISSKGFNESILEFAKKQAQGHDKRKILVVVSPDECNVGQDCIAVRASHGDVNTAMSQFFCNPLNVRNLFRLYAERMFGDDMDYYLDHGLFALVFEGCTLVEFDKQTCVGTKMLSEVSMVELEQDDCLFQLVPTQGERSWCIQSNIDARYLVTINGTIVGSYIVPLWPGDRIGLIDRSGNRIELGIAVTYCAL